MRPVAQADLDRALSWAPSQIGEDVIIGRIEHNVVGPHERARQEAELECDEDEEDVEGPWWPESLT